MHWLINQPTRFPYSVACRKIRGLIFRAKLTIGFRHMVGCLTMENHYASFSPLELIDHLCHQGGLSKYDYTVRYCPDQDLEGNQQNPCFFFLSVSESRKKYR